MRLKGKKRECDILSFVSLTKKKRLLNTNVQDNIQQRERTH